MTWWKNIAEMEAGLMTKYCWNGSGFDENNIVEKKAGLMKNYCWNGSGIGKIILLKWKRNCIKILPKWKLVDEKSIAEIEEGLVWRRILLKWKWDWWQNTAGLMKIYCWNKSGIDKKISLKWKPYWWKKYCWNGS